MVTPAPSAVRRPDAGPGLRMSAAVGMVACMHRKILWVTPHCLLDTSNGAAITSREILHALRQRGYEIAILTATVMDSPAGATLFSRPLDESFGERRTLIADDAGLSHRLYRTASTRRLAMTAAEEAGFFALFMTLLDEFAPDIVMGFGGLPLDLLVFAEARFRGCKTVGLMFNGSYQGRRWYRDLDHVVTESRATAALYRQREGLSLAVIGAVIGKDAYLARGTTRDALLFVTATLGKGAGIVATLAWLLEQSAPQLRLIVVEGRGAWAPVADGFFDALGEPRRAFRNVEVIPATSDMASLYGRTRLLLAPSLAYESLGRVVIEAMWNGIPAVVTNRHGPSEAVGDSGVRINLPEACFQAPHDHFVRPEALAPVAELVRKLCDDDETYRCFSDKARAEAARLHDFDTSIGNLVRILEA